MLQHIEMKRPEDFFTELPQRSPKGVYFYRINGYHQTVHELIKKYYDAARKAGVVIEGRIPNPDNKNLAYFDEMMGSDFRSDKTFLSQKLKKWLPRMNQYQNDAVAGAMADTLSELKNEGKNENMLKNAYIKFMCWLYYKFERIVSQLGNPQVPKILYEGDISNYEFLLIRILSGAGCDVLLLQYHGNAAYQKLDPQSRWSKELVIPGMTAFPKDFSLAKIREEITQEAGMQRLYGRTPEVMNCTNAWIEGKGLADFKVPVLQRGSDPKLFYNCYCRIHGVDSPSAYPNDLYSLRQQLKNDQRKVLVINDRIPPPSIDEVNAVPKQNYADLNNLLTHMAAQMGFIADPELKSLAVKAFLDTLRRLSSQGGGSLSMIANKAIYVLCWLKRYFNELLAGWKMPDVGCFIKMGGCKNENEALFVQVLARLPVDVLLLVPDKNMTCSLQDSLLYEVNYDESLPMTEFPESRSAQTVGTVAYHAERELDTIMYQDSGIYRNRQYGQANSVILKTMYEEVEQLWTTELKYRPNFSTEGGEVAIPVICAKICGVKNNDLAAYWSSVKRLFTPDTLLINRLPCIQPGSPNPVVGIAGQFIRNGQIDKEAIKRHSCYQYGVLRDEIQEHILDKMQMLISGRYIQGTFESFSENLIIATILNLDKNLVRMIQKFDFTKVNPKVVCLSLNEQSMSMEDTILFTFLVLVGFDLAIFVPTGYQTVERFFNPGKIIFQDHQIGDYMYDLRIPNFHKISDKQSHPSWRDKFFKRGN